MTRSEKRLRDFSSGMKKLGGDSRNYIHKLTRFLFLAEQPPVNSVNEKESPEQGNECFMNGKVDKSNCH